MAKKIKKNGSKKGGKSGLNNPSTGLTVKKGNKKVLHASGKAMSKPTPLTATKSDGDSFRKKAVEGLKRFSSYRKESSAHSPATDSEATYVLMLQAELMERQAEAKNYSMRSFASDLGVDSGTMSRILDGQRPLSLKAALRFLPSLRWDKEKEQALLESVGRQAIQLDNGAASLERVRRNDGKIKNRNITPSYVNMKQHLPSVESHIVLETDYKEDPEKGDIKNARAAIDRSLKKEYTVARLFFTTAVQGAKVDDRFLASIRTYLNHTGAEVFFIHMRPHLKALNDREYPLDRILHSEFGDSIYRNVEVNKFLTALNIEALPSAADPLSGVAELGAEDGRSYIFAHTQQRTKTYPNGLEDTARVQICTGAVTLPLYGKSKAGILGDKRHVVGGLIVEIYHDRFHFRHVQADLNGSFIDLGVRYNPDGTVVSGDDERPEALVRGDDHGGPEIFGDPTAIAALDDVTASLRPRKVFFHDIFDAASVSHHRARSISQTINVPAAAMTLRAELDATARFLEERHKYRPEDCLFYVVGANHNEHYAQYLDDGRWVKKPVDHNYLTALEGAYHYHKLGKSPLQMGVDPECRLAKWLERDEVVKVEGIMLSHHGDIGPNGSRGSVRGDLTSFGKSIAGHSHSPEILRAAIRVGTTSRLKLDYNRGPSSWAHAFALVYKGGLSQLIFIIDGKWRLNDAELKASEKAMITKHRKEKKAKPKKKYPKKLILGGLDD
jgi:hypothetical protein